jgi:hypothetical protein
MIIELKKFGTTLLSRQLGKEAFSAFQSTLKTIPEGESIMIDFEGVITFSPSWGDEFISPLYVSYGERITLKNTENSSVKATLKILEEVNKIKFKIL